MALRRPGASKAPSRPYRRSSSALRLKALGAAVVAVVAMGWLAPPSMVQKALPVVEPLVQSFPRELAQPLSAFLARRAQPADAPEGLLAEGPSAGGPSAESPSAGPAPAQRQAAAGGDGFCPGSLPYGAPQADSQGLAKGGVRLLCTPGYGLGHSASTRTALWVGQLIKAADTGGSQERTDDFFEEPELPRAERAWLSDYKGSGYARGHLAPAADFSRSAPEMARSFSLANMVPQDHKHNSGAWAALEGHVRKLARRHGSVVVLTGPVYNPASPRRAVPSGRVAIPDALFKVVYVPSTGVSAAWVIENKPVERDAWLAGCTSVAQAQQLVGLTFFPGLPDSAARSLSRKCALNS